MVHAYSLRFSAYPLLVKKIKHYLIITKPKKKKGIIVNSKLTSLTKLQNII